MVAGESFSYDEFNSLRKFLEITKNKYYKTFLILILLGYREYHHIICNKYDNEIVTEKRFIGEELGLWS